MPPDATLMPTLRRGTVLQVCKPFDTSMVQLGDRGILTGNGRLHIYTTKPSCGPLPIYDFDIGLVENGTFRIVETVTHDITGEELEAVHTRMDEYQRPRVDAYYKDLDLISIKLKDLNLRHQTDQKQLDDQLLEVLLRKGGTRVEDLSCDYTHQYNYGNRYAVLEESAKRLMVAGKILPFKEGGVLIPCR